MTNKPLYVACLALGLLACGDDSGTSTPDASVPPAKPTLGAQIDRMGRPAINTALDKTFTADATRDPAEDAYNGDTAKATWPATYMGTFAAQLAILDSIDRMCGNQVLAGSSAVVGRYNTLAGALADDQLYVNSASSTCAQYLAVEANATAVFPNSDCGGRKLEFDVIETTYSALVAGELTGVDDTVANDSTFKASFPYLADPNP